MFVDEQKTHRLRDPHKQKGEKERQNKIKQERRIDSQATATNGSKTKTKNFRNHPIIVIITNNKGQRANKKITIRSNTRYKKR